MGENNIIIHVSLDRFSAKEDFDVGVVDNQRGRVEPLYPQPAQENAQEGAAKDHQQGFDKDEGGYAAAQGAHGAEGAYFAGALQDGQEQGIGGDDDRAKGDKQQADVKQQLQKPGQLGIAPNAGAPVTQPIALLIGISGLRE